VVLVKYHDVNNRRYHFIKLFLFLQPMHLVGVSVNVIGYGPWVTSQGPCGEHVAYTNLRMLQY